jgi:hypothetical protein
MRSGITSYSFLQTPPLAVDALAIRIIFPLVRVTPLSFKQTGLPASLGKQKRATRVDNPFFEWEGGSGVFRSTAPATGTA